MANREENIERVAKLLSEKFGSLREEEINKMARHIYEMGSFLVCLMKKRASTHAKQHCKEQ